MQNLNDPLTSFMAHRKRKKITSLQHYFIRLGFALGLFVLYCFSRANAQVPTFKHFSTRDLGDVQMTTCIQDSKGWLWLGTKQGIFRFDGIAFTALGLPDSLAGSVVRCLFERQGQLWAGFEDGSIAFLTLDRYLGGENNGTEAIPHPKTTGFQRWEPQEGSPAKPVSGFATDRSGSLWFSTYGEGLYVWKNERLYQIGMDDGLLSHDVYAIKADGHGDIWAATDAGISICSMPERGKKMLRHLGVSDGLPDDIVTALSPDYEGNMWIGTHDKGFCRYNIATRQFEYRAEEWPYGEIRALAPYGPNELWIGTAEYGLLHYDLQSKRLTILPETPILCNKKIRSLYKDREGLLWAICDKGHLYAANVRFSSITNGAGNVQSLLFDRAQRLWAGCENGLFLQDKNGLMPVLAQKHNILSLWESPTGEIWVGTFGKGVLVLSPQGKVLRHITEKDGLSNGSILSVAGNTEGVWLATLSGVAYIPLKTSPLGGKPQTMPELGHHYVYKVFTDSKQRVWFGTDGQGLGLLENGHFSRIDLAAGVKIKTIYAIAEDRRGHLWFTTEGEGLFRFDGTHYQQFTTSNRMHHNTPAALAAAGDGCIVIGYQDGLDVLNPDRFDHFNFFDAETGVPVSEVNLNAMCSDDNGNVWIGTRKGIFKRSHFGEPFIDDPVPSLTSVSIFTQDFDFHTLNQLNHDQNYLTFNFNGLWYTHPEAVRYRYKLEGFDLDWKISKDHQASYPNLPPGNYTFRIQTSEHGNFDHVPETKWAFTIAQPFWTRWWFVLLSLATGVALIWWFIRTREERLRHETMLKKENVESQFAALKSQINPHFLFNSFNTLITIIEENPKIAVEYVEHLSDFYRSIMVYRESDFISLQEERELVRNFSYLLKKRYEGNFQLNDQLNGITGFVMPFALQMLVENAVKHNVISAAKPLIVEIFAEKDRYIVVRNNIQRKTKPEPGTHFGLKSLLTRYQLFGERPVIIEDDKAFFIVKIPIRNAL